MAAEIYMYDVVNVIKSLYMSTCILHEQQQTYRKREKTTTIENIYYNILVYIMNFIIQSPLVISKSKGPSETLRDIRTSTYQIGRIEEITNGTAKFNKLTCNLTPLVRNIC